MREEWPTMWDRTSRELFIDPIKDVLGRHPIGSKDEDGEEFWSGTRRGERRAFHLLLLLPPFLIRPPHYTPVPRVLSHDDTTEYSLLRTALESARPPLDKDDPTVIPLLVAMTSLRCESYGIPCPDPLHVRKMCGNIVPALVTSTSVASALAVFEATRGRKGGQWFVDMDGCGYFRAGGVRDPEEVRGTGVCLGGRNGS